MARPRDLTSFLLPLVAALLLAVLSGWARSFMRRPTVTGSPARLAILPFETVGTGKDSELGRGLDALLTSRLGDLEGYRLIPASPMANPVNGSMRPSEASARAERVGARYYVTGRIVVSPTGLRASAVIRDRANADREVGRSDAEAGPGDLFPLADQLVAGMVRDLYRGPGPEMARAAAGATRSLPALKAYLEGERALEDQQYVAARDAFHRAFRADSAFALAYYRCSIAADRLGDEETARWTMALAARFSDRLSEHDRRLVTAAIVARRGLLDEAERLYRGIVADYPQDVEAWFQLGELLLTGNPLRGRSARQAKSAFERVLDLDPEHGDATVHLAHIAALEGKPTAADSLLRRANLVAGSSRALDVRVARTLTLGEGSTAMRAVRDLLFGPAPISRFQVLEAAVSTGDLGRTERLARALKDASGACDMRGLGYRMLAEVAIARGKTRSFQHELAESAACDRGAALELRSILAVQPFLTTREAELSELARSLRLVPDSVMSWQSRSYYGALVALRAGDTLMASRSAWALLRAADTSDSGQLARSFGRSLQARLQLAARRPAEALAQLEGAGWERVAQAPVAEASDRYLRAELLHLLGRDEEAIGWYSTMAERAPYELVYLAPAELRLGRIYEARGDVDQATVHYGRFVKLWEQADPEEQQSVAKIRRTLSRLVNNEAQVVEP